jgi:hypothetical protein
MAGRLDDSAAMTSVFLFRGARAFAGLSDALADFAVLGARVARGFFFGASSLGGFFSAIDHL